ncbi:DUF5017 domain-containing protein [Sphingobacterium sp. SGG-5]|uniref:DUF5017 domain-containing protein n=1 Tax=Sphingobacterium sp. SGG-5 TaxID=2710881 RepID=UPI0013ECFFA3|nr:DUF5017 domain-containing protein [Sphingobacterium sp. SGG-5]NGM63049.1 DUF5017 domain-containing protein [Sphingobacterium sp. SGG-5]
MRKINAITPKTTILFWCMLFFAQLGFAQTTLSFKNAVQYGSQENNLSVMISTDFNGKYDLENVQKATWKDVTEKFHLASDKSFIASGDLDMSPWIKPGQQVYLAFRYLGQASPKPTQRSWVISKISLTSDGVDHRIPTERFTIVDAPENLEGATWMKSAVALRFRSNLSKIKSESWAIVPITEAK